MVTERRVRLRMELDGKGEAGKISVAQAGTAANPAPIFPVFGVGCLTCAALESRFHGQNEVSKRFRSVFKNRKLFLINPLPKPSNSGMLRGNLTKVYLGGNPYDPEDPAFRKITRNLEKAGVEVILWD